MIPHYIISTKSNQLHLHNLQTDLILCLNRPCWPNNYWPVVHALVGALLVLLLTALLNITIVKNVQLLLKQGPKDWNMHLKSTISKFNSHVIIVIWNFSPNKASNFTWKVLRMRVENTNVNCAISKAAKKLDLQFILNHIPISVKKYDLLAK